MLQSMQILAMDGPEFDSLIKVVQLVATLGLAIFTGTIASKTRRIDTLEERVTTSTKEVIEEKFKGMQGLAEIRLHALERSQETMAQRCSLLESKDHEVLLKVHQEISKLREVVATRDDLRQLREEVRKRE